VIEEHIRQQWTRRRPIAERGRRGDALAQVEARAIADHIREVEDSFARLRHAYAITAHKSQGSTFHTVLVDWGDLSTMRDAFEFNRGLYVAASRASHHMAIIT
jgi:ATP-dependent exoDNAse (exonuclease V) alpha subunit